MEKQHKSGYLMILMAGILWGTIGFFVHTLSELGAESSTIAFLRIFSGGLILVPVILVTSRGALFRVDKKALAVCIILGIFCQGLFNYSYNESISRVGVATAAVMLYTSPVFVCIMSRIFFHEKIGAVKLAALALNVAGCILTVTGGDFSTIHFSVYGVGAGVMAGFLYALMTVISKTATENYHPLTIMFYSFMFGAAFLAVLSQPWLDISRVMSGRFFLGAVGYGLVATVGPYCFYLKGLSMKLETSRVPVIASIETVVAAVIGLVLFSETGGAMKLAGIVCVVASIAIMNSVHSTDAKKQAA